MAPAIGSYWREWVALAGATAFNPSPSEAREILELSRRAIHLDPLGAPNWIVQGCLAEKFGYFQEAITSYQRALRLDPLNQPTVYSELGQLYWSRGGQVSRPATGRASYRSLLARLLAAGRDRLL